MNYDLIIVGSGPAGIFTALELIKRGTKKKMLLSRKVNLLKSVIVLRLKSVTA